MKEKILSKIQTYPQSDKLPCAVAHFIATELGVNPLEVGAAANEPDGPRITQCQLGLFGYGTKGTPSHKILFKVDVSDDLAQAIGEAAVDGKISCAQLWALAEEFNLTRREMGSAANELEQRITPCQLGCF